LISFLQTKNVEKYSKNKDRNKQRAIDTERAKIRIDAVHQAERLAAIHDPSGKTFNVGEVVVLPDGKVKTREALARSAELKVQREAQAKADKEAEEAWNTAKGYAKAGMDSYLTKAKEEGKLEAVALREWEAHLELASQIGPNTSDRARYVQVINRYGRLVNQKISKKQMRKRELLEPKPVPPRPVIPEGIPMLEGETNLVALWDITDQEILKRLADQKKQKSQASKDLRKVQKEQKKFNRALKLMKKQAANAGILWDPERAKRVILGLEPAYLPEESGEEKAESDSTSDDSSSEPDSDSDPEDEVDGTPNGEKSKKKKKSNSTSGDEKAPLTKKKKKMANPPRPKLDLSLLEKAAEIERERAEKKQEARLRRRKERKDAAEKKERELEELRAKEMAEQAKKSEAAAKGEVYVTDKAGSKKRKRELETEDVLRDKENAKKLKREQKVTAREGAKALREKEAQLEAERLKSAEEAAAVEEKKPKKEKRDKKDKKQKLVESNSKLDREIAGRERKLREENAEANGDDEVMEDVEEKKSKEKKEKKEKKDKKPKLVESNDAKLDREVAEREGKLREENAEHNGDGDAIDGVEASKPLYIKSTQHWNTMHLSGGRERQDKFARLLGAKKETKLSPEDEAKEKKKAKKRAREAEKADEAKAAELAKVQRDLEMQYEAGMKLKHDGGGKRRGLGA
jgi:hypothetical protein